MAEKFAQTVRESRVFFRRQLAVQLIREGKNPGAAVEIANRALQALITLEESEGLSERALPAVYCDHCGHPDCGCAQFAPETEDRS